MNKEEILADLGLILHEATDAMYAFAVGTEEKAGMEAVRAVRDLAERILKGEE